MKCSKFLNRSSLQSKSRQCSRLNKDLDYFYQFQQTGPLPEKTEKSEQTPNVERNVPLIPASVLKKQRPQTNSGHY